MWTSSSLIVHESSADSYIGRFPITFSDGSLMVDFGLALSHNESLDVHIRWNLDCMQMQQQFS